MFIVAVAGNITRNWNDECVRGIDNVRDEHLISRHSTETLMHMPREFQVTHCSAKPGMQNYFQVRLMLSRRSKEIHGKIGIYAAPLNFQNYASLRSYTRRYRESYRDAYAGK